jgi:hypothetical protein
MHPPAPAGAGSVLPSSASCAAAVCASLGVRCLLRHDARSAHSRQSPSLPTCSPTAHAPPCPYAAAPRARSGRRQQRQQQQTGEKDSQRQNACGDLDAREEAAAARASGQRARHALRVSLPRMRRADGCATAPYQVGPLHAVALPRHEGLLDLPLRSTGLRKTRLKLHLESNTAEQRWRGAWTGRIGTRGLGRALGCCRPCLACALCPRAAWRQSTKEGP